MNQIPTREARRWPGYIFGGRMRTTTAALLIAFFAIWWLYETYEPTPAPQQVPASEVVPPGFIPDPDYTWAPRTDVQRHTPTSTPTTTTPTTPTTTSTSPTTSSSTVTSSTSAEPAPPQPTSTPPTSVATPGPSEPPGQTDMRGRSGTTQTPAAAGVGPSTPAVSPPR